MKRAVIVSENCLNCSPCPVESNCSNKAIIREEPSDKPWIDFYLCSGCLKCKTQCMGKAIREITRPCDGNPHKSW